METKEIQQSIDEQQPKRKNAIECLKSYLSNPGRFSIVVLGERGTGKSKWVEQLSIFHRIKKTPCHNQYFEANCSGFSKELASSELFGYGKGVFSGQNEKGKLGLFLEAAGYKLDKNNEPTCSNSGGGVLFLDEVHQLDTPIFAKLLTSLQTKSSGKDKGKFIIKRLGDSKPYPCELRIVFGSNLCLNEIRQKIPTDLYDRICQLVVEFPSLKETITSEEELKKEFEKVYAKMDFTNPIYGTICNPTSKEFWKWLSQLELSGNYRDLENISIIWAEFTRQNKVKMAKKMEVDIEAEVLKQAIEYFDKLKTTTNYPNYLFNDDFTYLHYKNKFNYDYAYWALNNSGIRHDRKNSNDQFGDTGKTLKTLNEWIKKLKSKN